MNNQYQLDVNQHSSQSLQRVMSKSLVVLGEALKFLAGFIGEMVNMIRGRY